jgi:putative acyl-CoA dehydrogenase
MSFFQAPPNFGHPYNDDQVLKQYLKKIIPSDMFPDIESDLIGLGTKVTQEMEALSQEAESNPPVHVPYDPWGKRIDHIKVSKAWDRLHEIAAEEGIVSTGYERKQKEFSRVFQFAKLYLYHPSSAIYSCPLAMTDGAARVIELHGTVEMKKRAYKNLISRDPKTFWTSGQWMTERTGGSDVSGTSTVAKKDGDVYRLHGVKWFTSATTSQMAMTLARIEGEEKLSLFYVELRDKNGDLQNIQINRLKDKMGTKALPTAELTLIGTPATLVGESGKGVKTIATLFNITRLYNACCAVGYMRRGIALSKDYSNKRVAFGKPIIEHGLHAEMMSDLQVRFEASFLMTFHAALLLGKEEMKVSDEIESGTLRLLIPLVKLYTAKEGVAIASEVIESFGGAGYVEDTGLPQILRNAQVLAIWEGTTNVLSLDALRAIKKENAGEFFLKDVLRRMKNVQGHDELKKTLSAAIQQTQTLLISITDEENISTGARELALTLSRIYCASLLIENAEDERGKAVARRFIEKGLVSNFQKDLAHRKETSLILK